MGPIWSGKVAAGFITAEGALRSVVSTTYFLLNMRWFFTFRVDTRKEKWTWGPQTNASF